MRLFFLFAFSFFVNFSLSSQQVPVSSKKILIVGICKDVGDAVANTKKNAESLGSRFADYGVIIYENNSSDSTCKLFSRWVKTNPRVTFLSEHLTLRALAGARTEKIARARNIVLEAARSPQYKDFEYLMMVDLDFTTPWPIEEIVKTIESSEEWDCVAANGEMNGSYFDRYAFRDAQFPFGPELLGRNWWNDLGKTNFKLTGDKWVSVYSAFGGFALYKTATITQFAYSGTVTEDLKLYYENIVSSLPENHPDLQKYKKLSKNKYSKASVFFQENTPEQGHSFDVTCCEHIPLHASMAVHGYDKIFINPKMKMIYSYKP